jgi:large conductance mechanosensitive channel
VREFVEFLKKYGVVGLAIAVVIGGKVNELVGSLVSGLLMPILGVVLPGGAWQEMGIQLSADNRIAIGLILNAAIDFLIVAWLVFLFTRLVLERPAQAEA